MGNFSDLMLGDIPICGSRPFIIAEAGVNFENDLGIAFKMIEEAALAGADAIKFQSYKAERLASHFSPAYWDITKESTPNQFELFKKYDHFGDQDFIALAKKANSYGIYFLSTPFDTHYADLLEPYMPAYKIASADITNYPLIKHCAKKGKPIILSTGASTLAEVDNAISIIREEGNIQIALLHCVLSYPCDPTNANLATIAYLKKVYPQYVIGYSDHVPPTAGGEVLLTAWLFGARIIEKHFTLDKTKPGNDHYHAMDPEDLRAFIMLTKSIFSLIGDETKKVMCCEQKSREQARRSLVASRDIKSGEILQESDVAIKRPGTGIKPFNLGLVIGAEAICDIQYDQILQWDMFLRRKKDNV